MYQSNPELTKLQQEQATVEQQLKQLQHKQQRLENRKAYYEKLTARNAPTVFVPSPERLRVSHRILSC